MGNIISIPFVDDKSKATWTYLVHTKDQVLDILSGFVKYAEVHFNAKFKFLRLDNGTEVVNQKVLQFLTSKGIFHQKSMAYTTQQNGVVERKHRHFLERARALRIHASLPKKFGTDMKEMDKRKIKADKTEHGNGKSTRK
ncbi:retrovirus-related pol polyprotein from transposon TNT 1-94 [Tanacetum coccineum]